MLLGESPVVPRISDLAYLAASTRGKIELNLTEDDGQEDKVISKLLSEAVKNIFEHYFEPKHFRGLVEWFEGGKSFLTSDKLASKDYARRVNEMPLLKKEIATLMLRPELAPLALEAGEAMAASVAEFILEGLHVENRLNKNVKGGEIVFKR